MSHRVLPSCTHIFSRQLNQPGLGQVTPASSVFRTGMCCQGPFANLPWHAPRIALHCSLSTTDTGPLGADVPPCSEMPKVPSARVTRLQTKPTPRGGYGGNTEIVLVGRGYVSTIVKQLSMCGPSTEADGSNAIPTETGTSYKCMPWCLLSSWLYIGPCTTLPLLTTPPAGPPTVHQHSDLQSGSDSDLLTRQCCRPRPDAACLQVRM
jgi:hypothetical protein